MEKGSFCGESRARAAGKPCIDRLGESPVSYCASPVGSFIAVHTALLVTGRLVLILFECSTDRTNRCSGHVVERVWLIGRGPV